MMVPFWFLSKIRHLVFGGPKQGTIILTTAHILYMKAQNKKLPGRREALKPPLTVKPLAHLRSPELYPCISYRDQEPTQGEPTQTDKAQRSPIVPNSLLIAPDGP